MRIVNLIIESNDPKAPSARWSLLFRVRSMPVANSPQDAEKTFRSTVKEWLEESETGRKLMQAEGGCTWGSIMLNMDDDLKARLYCNYLELIEENQITTVLADYDANMV